VIVDNNSPQPAIDVAGPSTSSGALIHLWSNGGWSSQEWQPVQESSGAYHFVSHYSGLCLDVPSASTADSVQLQQYACNGTTASPGRSARSAAAAPPRPPTTVPPPTEQPDLGPNVKIFDPSMSTSSIQSTINSIYSSQQSNQFGTARYAMLFDPGTYDVDVRSASTRRSRASARRRRRVSDRRGHPRGRRLVRRQRHPELSGATWRTCPTPELGTLEYAVSQADPFRRVDVHGNLTLDDYTSGNTSSNWSSGGYIGDSRILRNDQFGYATAVPVPGHRDGRLQRLELEPGLPSATPARPAPRSPATPTSPPRPPTARSHICTSTAPACTT